MKKEEIIFIRIMTVIGASALMALILIFGAGSGLFQKIVNNINGNVLDLNSADASIYNLYFYKGLHTVYRVLYSVTLFGLILTAAAMFVKLKGAGVYAVISSVMAVVTGLYLLLCNIFEGNVALHRFIDRFYLEETGTIVPADMLGLSWITGLLLILIGMFCLVVVKSTRLDKIKAYGGSSAAHLGVMVPVLFGSLFFELIRELVIAGICSHADPYIQSAYQCVRDYYFADAWFFHYPYVIYLILTALGIIFLKKTKLPLPEKIDVGLIIPVLLVLVGIVRSIVYYLNAPPLFGYLTFDETLCDLIESAYPVYMMVYLFDMIFLMAALIGILEQKHSSKKILAACGINMAVSIIVIVIAGSAIGLTGIYIGCIAADIIGLFCFLYSRNIGRSHH